MISKKYECILFDLDGTLVDSVPVIIESFQRAVFAVYGRREENTEILKNSIGLPLKDSFAPYPASDQTLLQEAFIKANGELQKNGIPLFDNMYETLAKLRETGSRLAIVTSKRREPVMYLLGVMGIGGFFETVVARESTRRHKPFGDPIKKCMEIMGVDDANVVLYVGDSIHDLKCARDAGVDVALVGWTRMDKAVLRESKPEYWLNTPENLLDFACP